jgi:hypothetical protein
MMTLIHSMMGLGTGDWSSKAEGFPLPRAPPSDSPLERGEHPHNKYEDVSVNMVLAVYALVHQAAVCDYELRSASSHVFCRSSYHRFSLTTEH